MCINEKKKFKPHHVYLLDTNYYAYIHDLVHFHVLYELQLFHFSSFSLHYITRKALDDNNERTVKFYIYKYLTNHPLHNTTKVSNFILDRLCEFKLYSLNIQHVDGEFFVVKRSDFV